MQVLASYQCISASVQLRPREEPRDYGHMHSTTTLEGIAMTQYNMKKQGVKIFGNAGIIDAVLKEIKQLPHDRKGLEPKCPNEMSDGDKHPHGALQYLMFLKQIRIGAIKGRRCSYGCE